MGKDNEFRPDLIDEPPYVIFLHDKPLDMLLVPQSAGVGLIKLLLLSLVLEGERISHSQLIGNSMRVNA